MLNDINLEIKARKIICVLEKSACGKYTFLNLLAGYLKSDSGEILIDGKVVDDPATERTRCRVSATCFVSLIYSKRKYCVSFKNQKV